MTRAFPDAAPLNDAAVAAGKVDLSRIHFATIPTSLDPVDVAARLSRFPEVEYAEPKYMYHLAAAPNDSDYTTMQQAYFDRMQVAAGWAIQKGSANVVIATIDGGTNWQHPDLAANIWVNPLEDINHNGRFDPHPASEGGDEDGIDEDGDGKADDVIGWNFGNNTNNPRGFVATPGSADHGTETASGFGAVTDNGIGMAGTSWNCKILPVCVSDPTMDLNVPYGFEGIEYASRVGATVINCSWYRAGGWANSSQFEQDVITAATQAGALIVAAAGNDFLQNLDDAPYYPASYQHVLSAGATKASSDEIANFTDIGLSVSAFAPGMGIFVCKDNGGYGTDQGTSHAAPIVAGLAGLLFSQHPNWTPDQVAEQIRMTSDPIDAVNPNQAGSLGHGRVNFYRALSEVHAGIVVEADTFYSPSGRSSFKGGDTVILSVKVKNVLPLAAENLSFSASADPALILLGPVHAPTRLDAGVEDSFDVYFRVRESAPGWDAHVRLSWSANADERDARIFETTVFAGTGGWEHQKTPTTLPLNSVHAVSSSIVWAAGCLDWTAGGRFTLASVLKTTDGGNNWVSVTGDLSNLGAICVFAVDSLRAWVGDLKGGIQATTDGGVSWKTQNYPRPYSAYFDGFYFFDAMHGYALGDPGADAPNKFVFLQTTNGGETWTHLANEPDSRGSAAVLKTFCCTDKQHIWFGTTNSTVWRTSDGGDTWSSTTVGRGFVYGLAMRDDSMGVVCTDGTLFARTTNGGATWLGLPGIKPDGGWTAAFPVGSATAWIAGTRTVACSHDNGATWALQPTEPLSAPIYAMSFSDSASGWIVTGSGEILRYRNRTGTASVSPGRFMNLPVKAELQQNYPNPFNPKTVVRSQTPEASDVRIVIYDLLGREVKVLVNERRAAGYYEDNFDASGLASGVYLYRLTAGSFVQTRKMILLK